MTFDIWYSDVDESCTIVEHGLACCPNMYGHTLPDVITARHGADIESRMAIVLVGMLWRSFRVHKRAVDYKRMLYRQLPAKPIYILCLLLHLCSQGSVINRQLCKVRQK